MFLATSCKQQIRALCHSSVWGQDRAEKWPEFHPGSIYFPKKPRTKGPHFSVYHGARTKGGIFFLLDNLLIPDLPTPPGGKQTEKADTLPQKALLHLVRIPAL